MSEQNDEWVADIYHKGKRLRFRGCGPGDETPHFSLTPVRHEHSYSTIATAHLHGRLVDYIDAPPPIFPEGAEG